VNWNKPSRQLMWRAIETYLRAAYDGAPSPAVTGRLESLRAVPDEFLYQSPHLEPTPKQDPIRFSLRLGNRWYPHMKLAIERSPDGSGCLFRADTHDQHIRPAPESREYAAFCELMEKNQRLASRIEAEWEAQGIPTFKSFLRDDLARRGVRPS
jgi:hypothetical protein